MTVTQWGRSRVTGFAPPSRSVFGSLLSVAEVREGAAWLDSADMVESYNCVTVQHVLLDECDTWSFSKDFGAVSWTDGIRFVVQGGVECSPVGFNAEDPRLRASFEVMEAQGVSAAIREELLNAGTVIDLTPTGGAVTPLQGLGVLESAGLARYAGYPVIHMGPVMAAQLTGVNVLTKAGDHLETHLGTPVAVSAGIETNTSGKVDAEQWAFVTGAVILARSDLVAINELDRSTNDHFALFERMYLAAIDCFAAKVKVKVL